MKMRVKMLAISAAVWIAACASMPTAPAESVAAHETTAARLEASADTEELRYDAIPLQPTDRCRAAEEVCWTSRVNPTRRHLAHAAEHRREAEAHRAAATALRTTETAACIGISAADRDESPFDHVDDIIRIEPLRGGVQRYFDAPQTEGVVVVFRSVPGMTAAGLQHLMDCHVARNAAVGNAPTRMRHCLLVPRGVSATVTTVADGFAVTIRAPDGDTAHELFVRADHLLAEVRSTSVR
jgi:hypothetical protein